MSYWIVVLVLGLLGLAQLTYWAPRRYAAIAERIDHPERQSRFRSRIRRFCAIQAIGAAVVIAISGRAGGMIAKARPREAQGENFSEPAARAAPAWHASVVKRAPRGR